MPVSTHNHFTVQTDQELLFLLLYFFVWYQIFVSFVMVEVSRTVSVCIIFGLYVKVCGLFF